MSKEILFRKFNTKIFNISNVRFLNESGISNSVGSKKFTKVDSNTTRLLDLKVNQKRLKELQDIRDSAIDSFGREATNKIEEINSQCEKIEKELALLSEKIATNTGDSTEDIKQKEVLQKKLEEKNKELLSLSNTIKNDSVEWKKTKWSDITNGFINNSKTAKKVFKFIYKKNKEGVSEFLNMKENDIREALIHGLQSVDGSDQKTPQELISIADEIIKEKGLLDRAQEFKSDRSGSKLETVDVTDEFFGSKSSNKAPQENITEPTRVEQVKDNNDPRISKEEVDALLEGLYDENGKVVVDELKTEENLKTEATQSSAMSYIRAKNRSEYLNQRYFEVAKTLSGKTGNLFTSIIKGTALSFRGKIGTSYNSDNGLNIYNFDNIKKETLSNIEKIINKSNNKGIKNEFAIDISNIYEGSNIKMTEFRNMISKYSTIDGLNDSDKKKIKDLGDGLGELLGIKINLKASDRFLEEIKKVDNFKDIEAKAKEIESQKITKETLSEVDENPTSPKAKLLKTILESKRHNRFDEIFSRWTKNNPLIKTIAIGSTAVLAGTFALPLATLAVPILGAAFGGYVAGVGMYKGIFEKRKGLTKNGNRTVFDTQNGKSLSEKVNSVKSIDRMAQVFGAIGAVAMPAISSTVGFLFNNHKFDKALDQAQEIFGNKPSISDSYQDGTIISANAKSKISGEQNPMDENRTLHESIASQKAQEIFEIQQHDELISKYPETFIKLNDGNKIDQFYKAINAIGGIELAHALIGGSNEKITGGLLRGDLMNYVTTNSKGEQFIDLSAVNEYVKANGNKILDLVSNIKNNGILSNKIEVPVSIIDEAKDNITDVLNSPDLANEGFKSLIEKGYKAMGSITEDGQSKWLFEKDGKSIMMTFKDDGTQDFSIIENGFTSKQRLEGILGMSTNGLSLAEYLKNNGFKLQDEIVSRTNGEITGKNFIIKDIKTGEYYSVDSNSKISEFKNFASYEESGLPKNNDLIIQQIKEDIDKAVNLAYKLSIIPNMQKFPLIQNIKDNLSLQDEIDGKSVDVMLGNIISESYNSDGSINKELLTKGLLKLQGISNDSIEATPVSPIQEEVRTSAQSNYTPGEKVSLNTNSIGLSEAAQPVSEDTTLDNNPSSVDTTPETQNSLPDNLKIFSNHLNESGDLDNVNNSQSVIFLRNNFEKLNKDELFKLLNNDNKEKIFRLFNNDINWVNRNAFDSTNHNSSNNSIANYASRYLSITQPNHVEVSSRFQGNKEIYDYSKIDIQDFKKFIEAEESFKAMLENKKTGGSLFEKLVLKDTDISSYGVAYKKIDFDFKKYLGSVSDNIINGKNIDFSKPEAQNFLKLAEETLKSDKDGSVILNKLKNLAGKDIENNENNEALRLVFAEFNKIFKSVIDKTVLDLNSQDPQVQSKK